MESFKDRPGSRLQYEAVARPTNTIYKGPRSIFARSSSKLTSLNQQVGYARPSFRRQNDTSIAFYASSTQNLDYCAGQANMPLETEFSREAPAQSRTQSRAQSRAQSPAKSMNRSFYSAAKSQSILLNPTVSKTLLSSNLNTNSNEALDKLQDLKEIKIAGQSQFEREVDQQKRLPKSKKVCLMNKLQENVETGERDDVYHSQATQVLAEHCSPRQLF